LKKFLVIQTAFIGDVILATAVVEKLHRFFPDAEIDFLVRKGNESLLQGHPHLNKVLVWDKKNKKYNQLFSLMKEVRAKNYDHVINLQRFAASGFITAFSGAKETIGFDKNPLSFLFSKRFSHTIGSKEKPGVHEVERCLKLIEHLTDQSIDNPRLYPSEADKAVVQPLIVSNYCTISPASVWYTKQAPAEYWIKLIKNTSYDTYYLLGAPCDHALCENIKQACSPLNVQVLAGKLSLLQSAVLMQCATMNFTNDSAPMHLCSATNAPVTAVFCSTIPEFGFGPLSQNSHIIETSEQLDCRPCGLHGYSQCPKGHFKCSILPLPHSAA
jgi:heptosyltransferase II